MRLNTQMIYFPEGRRKKVIKPFKNKEMKTKHTPRPWTMSTNKHSINISRFEQEEDTTESEWTGLAKVYFSGGCPDDPEGLANAKLISASPDLLRALRKLVKICKQYDTGHILWEIRQAEKAIKKATK